MPCPYFLVGAVRQGEISIAEPMLNRPVCAFDIETVPDADYGRTFMGLSGEDLVVQDAMQQAQLEATEGRTDFLPVHLHKVVTLSLAWWDPKHARIKVSSLAEEGVDEPQILRRFVDVLAVRPRPRLISWNGDKFDLPVLQYRWMHHRISAPDYWQPPNRYDAYVKRYSHEHIDLADVLGGFRNPVKLDQAAQLCGFPGKTVTEGHRVFQHINRGEVELVQGYCEMDALNTLLLFMRWCVTRGEISVAEEAAFHLACAEHLRQRASRPGWAEMAENLDRIGSQTS